MGLASTSFIPARRHASTSSGVAEAVNADQVVVLPNNKNIIPVAEQLDALTAKSVRVVPTTSMPAALAALVVYDPEADAEVNLEEMTEGAASVATGEITQAVRDTKSDVGLVGAACALLDHLITAGREIVTVITGSDASAGHTDVLLSWILEHRPEVQVEVHRGGQPLYPYLFGVE